MRETPLMRWKRAHVDWSALRHDITREDGLRYLIFFIIALASLLSFPITGQIILCCNYIHPALRIVYESDTTFYLAVAAATGIFLSSGYQLWAICRRHIWLPPVSYRRSK
jgi:hypothetical protein